MTEIVNQIAIYKQAEKNLTLGGHNGQSHTLIWDHSIRVCESAMMLINIPEMVNRGADPEVLAIVALYHDAGWAVQCNAGDILLEDIFASVPTTIQFTLAASFMLEQLGELAPDRTLKEAAECIRVLGDHDIDHPCAQVVCEADHLDEFAVSALGTKVFKQVSEGRSVDAIIETSVNHHKYGFWEAKIKESFRFESTRRIAENRLKAFERLIQDMRLHHQNIDIRDAIDLK